MIDGLVHFRIMPAPMLLHVFLSIASDELMGMPVSRTERLPGGYRVIIDVMGK